MKISVITVCFNSVKTIDRTIKSVLEQHYKDIEYIIVDGESTDGTLDIVRRYKVDFKDNNIEFKFISEKDSGMYDAMNKGIHMATGDIIGILNSDDWYEKETLSIVAQKANLINSDIYMGAIRLFNGNQIIIKRAKDRAYKTSRHFNHPAMFVRKQCYEKVGDYMLGNVHNDFGWYLKAIKNNAKVTTIDDILTNYPTGGAGSVKNFKETVKRISKKYEVYKSNGYSRLYWMECAFQELAKYILLKD